MQQLPKIYQFRYLVFKSSINILFSYIDETERSLGLLEKILRLLINCVYNSLLEVKPKSYMDPRNLFYKENGNDIGNDILISNTNSQKKL